MAFETHGFFTGGPKKILEDCGHIVLGLFPLDLLWYAREWTTAKLPWPFKGQWPPGDPFVIRRSCNTNDPRNRKHFWDEQVTRLDNVRNSARDEFGRSIGAQLRFLILLGLVLFFAIGCKGDRPEAPEPPILIGIEPVKPCEAFEPPPGVFMFADCYPEPEKN